MWPSETSLVAGIVTVTMVLTPFSLMLDRFLLRPEPDDTMEEDFEDAGGSVLVIGFGRFGQIVSQVLLARNIEATLIDASAERVRQASRFGFRIYFGDGTKRDVLRSAGAGQASVICVCVARPAVSNHIVELIRSEFPNARIFVRSHDRTHTLELLAKGVDYEIRETFESAMAFGGETLRGLGFDSEEVEAVIEEVRRRDRDRLTLQRSGGVTATGEAPPAQALKPEPLLPPARRHRDDSDGDQARPAAE